jgi:hypothetical protein
VFARDSPGRLIDAHSRRADHAMISIRGGLNTQDLSLSFACESILMHGFADQTELINRVVVICDDASAAGAITQLFEKGGYPARCHEGGSGQLDLDQFGAVVFMARSNDRLRSLLGSREAEIGDEEWILVDGAGEDDFHCTVQLTPHASLQLRAFVRSLWALYHVT